MPVVIEKEGKPVSEATISACEELGVARDEIEVEVLEEGSKGVLGLGGKNARVRVTVKTPRVTEKGLRAKKTLEDLMEFIADSYWVELDERDDEIRLNVRCGEDKALVIGRRGENLGAIEYLVGRIASKYSDNGREKRVYIDVDGYKKKREQTIANLVKNAARKAKKTGKPVPLGGLPSHERKIAYNVIKRIGGVTTQTKEENGGRKTIMVVPTRRNPSRERREEG